MDPIIRKTQFNILSNTVFFCTANAETQSKQILGYAQWAPSRVLSVEPRCNAWVKKTCKVSEFGVIYRPKEPDPNLFWNFLGVVLDLSI